MGMGNGMEQKQSTKGKEQRAKSSVRRVVLMKWAHSYYMRR